MVLKRAPPAGVAGGNSGFLLAFAVTLGGRILMTGEIGVWGSRWGLFWRVISEPVLSLGYALMLWNVVSSTSIFARALKHPRPKSPALVV